MIERRDYITPKQARILCVLAARSFGCPKKELLAALNNDGLEALSPSAFAAAVSSMRQRGFLEKESPFDPDVKNKVHQITPAGRAMLERQLGQWRRLIAIFEGKI